jgi:hypothetical protein
MRAVKYSEPTEFRNSLYGGRSNRELLCLFGLDRARLRCEFVRDGSLYRVCRHSIQVNVYRLTHPSGWKEEWGGYTVSPFWRL